MDAEGHGHAWRVHACRDETGRATPHHLKGMHAIGLADTDRRGVVLIAREVKGAAVAARCLHKAVQEPGRQVLGLQRGEGNIADRLQRLQRLHHAAVLAAEALLLHLLADDTDDLGHLERLLHIAGRALVQRIERRVQGGVGRDHDACGLRADRLHLREQIGSLHIRQAEVEERDVKGCCARQGESFGGRAGSLHAVAHLFEDVHQRRPGILLVIHDQDSGAPARLVFATRQGLQACIHIASLLCD